MEKNKQEMEALEENWHQIAQNHAEYLSVYTQKIDNLLQEKDYFTLSELLRSETFIEKLSTHTDMAYMAFCNKIYMQEQIENVPHTVWENRNTVREIIEYIKYFKFVLWHVEFETEAAAGKNLLRFLEKQQTSMTMLKYMIYAAGMKKPELTERLIILFLDAGMQDNALAMLKYADELTPGYEDILCLMANLYFESGKKQKAVECLDKIKEPTEMAKKFKRLCEE